MIQDIFPQKLNNEFRIVEIEKNDRVVIFEDRNVLVSKDEKGDYYLPEYSEIEEYIEKKDCIYLFRIDDTNYFGSVKKIDEFDSYMYEGIKNVREISCKSTCFAVYTAFHLITWYKNNKFCGRCGNETVKDNHERMLFCKKCGNMIYPKIAPAVIVALTNKDKILMTKYADREYKKYALLAGFTEIGETAEETVLREVMEEVGLKVKNIRYYKSQPWGCDSNLLLGYFCELDGSDKIIRDESELALAEWYHRDEMPAVDDGISLTREMMRVFKENRKKL